MCGIAGVFQGPASQTVKTMVRTISHRGPDGRGVMNISDRDFLAEQKRLREDWDYRLQNKEALYYYRILSEFYDDETILPSMGKSRSL